MWISGKGNVTESGNPIWSKTKELLKKELDNDRMFNIWFGPVNCLSATDEAVVLEVPHKYFKDWLVERYINLMKSSILKASGKDLRLDFVFKESGDEAVLQKNKEADVKKEKGFWPFSRQAELPPKEIGLIPRYTFEFFVVGPSNRFAHAAALGVSDSPAKAYNPLFIYGGVGLGKTHLMHAIGQRVLQKFPRNKVLYISSEEFTNQLIGAIQTRSTVKFRERYRGVDVLLIDDIHFIAGKESTQEEFFHTFNALHDSHKQIVVSSDKPPKEIHSLEERLISRFGWGLVTDIQPPDFETRMAILKKKSEGETTTIPNEVLIFLAEKIKSNIRELEGALIRIVAYAKLIEKDISVDLVREEKKITIEFIQKRVSEYFDIKLTDMRAKKRHKAIVYPRQIAMYLSRRLTGYSLPEIGDQFGGRDHTTVMHAHEKIENDLKVKDSLRDIVSQLIRDIKG